MNKLPIEFYLRKNVVSIAKDLLGKILCVKIENKILSGIIIETEAYSFKERGSHAYNGMTKRNEVMFKDGGIAYVYLCYGIHEMFNVVTNVKGKAEAVLIRALEPYSGLDAIEQVKGKSRKNILGGPGKLTKALGIDRTLNGIELTGNKLWIEDGNIKLRKKDIEASKRIGIDYAGVDALLPWRFTIKNLEDYLKK